MKIAAKALVSAVLLALLLWLLPWDSVVAAIRAVPPGAWFAVLAGVIAGHAVGITKWRGFVNAGHGGLSVRQATMCYSAGLFTNFWLPTVVGGDLLRLGLAGRLTGRAESALWGTILDRVTDVLALAALVTVGGVLSGSILAGWAPKVLQVAALLLFGAGLAALVVGYRRPLARWPRRIRRPVGRTLVAIRRLRRNPAVAARGIAVAFSMQIWFVLLNMWLGSKVGIEVPLSVWLFAWPLAKLSGLLPISLGGLAVREASLAALLLPFGVPAARSVVCALVWQSVAIGTALIGGLVWFILSRQRLSMRVEAARAVKNG